MFVASVQRCAAQSRGCSHNPGDGSQGTGGGGKAIGISDLLQAKHFAMTRCFFESWEVNDFALTCFSVKI